MRCGKIVGECDEEICHPGCICPEGEWMWENGITCASMCLITTIASTTTLAPTTVMTTIPAACYDRLENCETEAAMCNADSLMLRETMKIACPMTCKNIEVCGNIFTTTTIVSLPPTTPPIKLVMQPSITTRMPWPKCVDRDTSTCTTMKASGRCNRRMYPSIVNMCRKTCNACDMPPLKPLPTTTTTPLPTTTVQVTTPEMTNPPCINEHPLCYQLKKHCRIDRIARRCLKTCNACHLHDHYAEVRMKESVALAERKKLEMQVTTVETPIVITLTPELCIDNIHNCVALVQKNGRGFCMHPTLQQNCRKTCIACLETVTTTMAPTVGISADRGFPLNPPEGVQLSCIQAKETQGRLKKSLFVYN